MDKKIDLRNMTKYETLKATYEMWSWLSKNPDKDKYDYFYEVLGYSVPLDADKIPNNECYACSYAIHQYIKNGCGINIDDVNYRKDIDDKFGNDVAEKCAYCPMPCFGWDENGEKILICDGTFGHYTEPSLFEVWNAHDEFRRFKRARSVRSNAAKEIAKIAYNEMIKIEKEC